MEGRVGRRTTPPPEPVAETKVARISADSTLVSAANGFLESWLVRKDYDAAFRYLSQKSHECYNLEKNAESPVATSPEDAERRLRAALEAWVEPSVPRAAWTPC